MENLGSHLQKLREEKGISYDKVFEDLRLREDQLRLIEENRYFELGHFGFAKAMVHKYAGYLGADLDEVMAEFKVMVPENTKKQPVRGGGSKSSKIMLSPNLLWLLGIILFVIVLGAILWYAHNQGWLKTPEFLKPAAADTTVVSKPRLPQEKEPKVDPMREVQKEVTKAAAIPSVTPAQPSQGVRQAVQDSTDHIGELMGPSQVNVELE
ncbi:MAG: helix-turn-helix domain-containing protein [Candidatus Cloacimonadota bacterium]|nr:helix-turn-helix domain-containing protein [Candidatus Cloacimonadota bacterium]